MSLATKSSRSALFLGTSTILNVVSGFFGGIILARLLNPNDFGTYALAVTLAAFVDLRSKLQLEQKFLHDRDEGKQYLDTFFTLNFGVAAISFLLILVTACGAVLLQRPDLAVCLIVVGLVGLVDPVCTSIRLSIEKQVAFGAVAIAQTTSSVTQFAGSLICAIAGFGLWSLLIGLGLGEAVNVVLYWRIAPRRPSFRLDRPLAREFLTYGAKYGAVFATSAVIITQFDNFILGLVAGTFALGFYDRAYRTALWPTQIISAALGRISLPTYSKLRDDPVRLQKAFSMVLWTVLTFTTPVALVLFVTAPELVTTVYGDKWLPSVPILQLLAAFAIMRPLWDDMVSVLVATGRPGQMARLVFVQAIALIALAVPLTIRFGGAGTAISVGVAFMISAGFLLYFGRTVLEIDVLETAGLPILNNLLALFLYLLIKPILPWQAFSVPLQLLGEIALLSVLYLLSVFATSRKLVFSRARYLIQIIQG